MEEPHRMQLVGGILAGDDGEIPLVGGILTGDDGEIPLVGGISLCVDHDRTTGEWEASYAP